MRYLSRLRCLIVLIALACTACGTALPTIKPFKMDIQQGNVVTSKMLLQLRPGMTKSQVRYIMGTPLIQDSFHGNRWDYAYQMREQGKVIEQRRVILEFENELLAKVRGDVTPSKGEKSAAETAPSNIGTRTINPSAKPASKSMLDKFKFWKKDETTPAENLPSSTEKKVAPEMAAEQETQAKELAAPIEKAVDDASNSAKETATDAAPTPMLPTIDSAPPAEGETKSILSVPLALPLPSAPAAAEVSPPAAPSETKPAASIAPAKVEPSPAVPAEPAKVSPAAEAAVVPAKKLAPAVKEVLPEAKTKAPAVEASKPAESDELPPEDSPSFFDKMLEKIGF